MVHIYISNRRTARPPVGGAVVRPQVGGGQDEGAGQDDRLTELRYL